MVSSLEAWVRRSILRALDRFNAGLQVGVPCVAVNSLWVNAQRRWIRTETARVELARTSTYRPVRR
jgi:hypothetical protein